MFYKTYVALDITGSAIRVMSVKKRQIDRWGTATLEAGLIKDGIIKNPQAVSIVIDNLFKSLELKRDRVICTVTGLPFIYRLIGMPDASLTTLDEAIRREAKREMSISEEDMYLLWQATQTRTNDSDQDYFVVGLPKHAIKILADTLSSANIKPFIVDVKPLALARVVSSRDAWVASLEPDYIDVVAISDGVIRVIHSISPTEKSTNHVRIVNEFIEALDKTEKSLKREYPQNTLNQNTPLLLSGELSLDDRVVRHIREATGRPVSVVEWPAFASSKIPPGVYAANIGLILKKQNRKNGDRSKSVYHDINLNILSALKNQPKLKLQPVYAVISVVFLASVLWGTRAYMGNIETSSHADSLQKEVDGITAQIVAMKKTARDLLAKKTAAVEVLATAEKKLVEIRSSQRRLMDLRIDFASRVQSIIGDTSNAVTVESIYMEPDNITVTGRAADAFDVIVFANALENDGAFASARTARIEPLSSTGVSFEVVISE
jgi:Tfp pilus assembly protein PilN